jgi:glycosyltransferase involved in cell wall biosynthesis
LPHDLFKFRPESGSYLAFLGRASPEKRVDRAIEIAKRTRMPLKIAAKVDRADRSYFKREIEPLLNDFRIEWIGEINDKDKDDFLGNAYALLFPIDWPEPFGLVLIEALACGTPVIAYRCGSVPEIIENGINGYIVGDQQQAVAAARRIERINRAACRRAFERRFTARRMAEQYVAVYAALSAARRAPPDTETADALSL